MQSKFFLFLLCSVITALAAAQTTTEKVLADYEALKKMTPAQLEAYKKQVVKEAKAKAMAMHGASQSVIENRLDPAAIQPPVKDVKRLQLLPGKPPDRTELVKSLQQSARQIKQGIPAPKLEEIKEITSTHTIESINEKAIMEFYSDDPRTGVAMMLEAAAKAPDTLLLLNNLAAMFNMHGEEDRAIPVLQYCLEKVPESSTILNNIGQSFMALGDVMKAAAYFRKCLAVDSLNVEANHSMGLLHYFKKEYDAAMPYFERELSMAIRSSTLALQYKMGKKFNLRAIMDRRRRNNGRPEKNHFEEITLGKFVFPQLPATARQLREERYLFDNYGASVQAEQLNWINNANKVTTDYTSANGNEHAGLYTELVNAMLDELQKEFTPEYLSTITQSDLENIQEMYTLQSNILIQLKCADYPKGTTVGAQEAYDIKCCRELLEPVADQLIYQVSSYLQPIIRKGEGRWKSYINQLVEIVQLDPSEANKAMVYHAVSGYFNFLSVSMVSFSLWEVNNLLPKCVSARSAAALDSLIESDRNWRVSCPTWLNATIDFKGMAVKIDCNKYAIEAGSSIAGAYEYEFKTGKSTLLIGPATKAEFLGIKASMKNQAYISFDRDKNFADFGIKSTADVSVSANPIPLGPRIKIGGTLAGLQVSNSLSINGGFQKAGDAKGIFKLFKLQ